MTGFLIVDKPAGLTSHDVVNRIRRITGQKKAGHTGTLDPFATGVLPVALGEATKAITFLDESVKEYKGILRLGICTDTQDCTGTVIAEGDWRSVTEADLTNLFRSFLGEQRQQPPMYSALKHNGTPLYKLARQGVTIDRKMRDIVIHSMTIDDFSLPDVSFTVRCSRGTYVRTLANDVGAKAGCGASLAKLQRTATGPFRIEHALSFAAVEELYSSGDLPSVMVPLLDALRHLPEVALTERGGTAVSHGVVPVVEDMVLTEILRPGARVKLTCNGKLVAVAEILGEIPANTSNFMRFLRVFN